MRIIESIRRWYSCGGKVTLLKISYWCVFITSFLAGALMIILSILSFSREKVVGGVSFLIFAPFVTAIVLLWAALIGGEIDYVKKVFTTFSFISRSNRITNENARDQSNIEEVFLTQEFTKKFNSTNDSTIDTKNYVLDLYNEGIVFFRKSDRKEFFIKNINISSLYIDDKEFILTLKNNKKAIINTRDIKDNIQVLTLYIEYFDKEFKK